MSVAEVAPDAAPKKKSKLPLLIGVVLALLLGGGGFYATYSGAVLGPPGDAAMAEPSAEGHGQTAADAGHGEAAKSEAEHGEMAADAGHGEPASGHGEATSAEGGHGAATPGRLPELAFVPIQQVVISLGSAANNAHLIMSSQLEVDRPMADEVTMLMPRILDVINGYLRAVDVAQLEDPSSLVTLRAQMLRRIQIVTGEGRVRDLLITEFVLN